MSFLKRSDKWWLLFLITAFVIIWLLGDAKGDL
jgi:hypothetical protein